MTGNFKSLRKLRNACEKAKRALSSTLRASISIESLYDGEDFDLEITRAKFDDLCSKDFMKITELIDRVLTDSEKSKSSIDQIILVGGSTRIPKMQTIISEYFDGKTLNKKLHADEAIAFGAAIHAHNISAPIEEDEESTLLLDVIPLSLGIETAGGIMTNLIPRNTVKPAEKSQIFSTYENNQNVVTIKIFEGERQFTKDNHLLGKFNLMGIPSAPKGVPQIEVTFDVDVDGLLSVSAVDLATKNKENVKIENSETLSAKEIEQMIQKSEEMEEQDRKRKNVIEIRDSLESIVYAVNDSIPKYKDVIETEDKHELQEIMVDVENWLEKHDINNTEFGEFEDKIQEIEGYCHPILTKLYDASFEKRSKKEEATLLEKGSQKGENESPFSEKGSKKENADQKEEESMKPAEFAKQNCIGEKKEEEEHATAET